MNRRDFISESMGMAAGIGLGAAAGISGSKDPQMPGTEASIVVLAELLFPREATARAAELLAELAIATRAEPGCRRYVVAQDLEDPGRFHLSEHWQDIEALAAHFETAHMAAFSNAARPLGYSAPFLKQITVADMTDLRPSRLRAGNAAISNASKE